MSLHVLSVVDPLRSVGMAGCGDAERLVEQLDEALFSAGHFSTVVAAEGSRIAGRLVATSPTVPFEQALAEHREVVGELIANGAFDLVHVHGHDFGRYLPASTPPVLVTLHERPDRYPEEVFADDGNLRISCVSGSQRRSCPGSSRLVESIPPGASADGPVRAPLGYVVAVGTLPRSGTVRELSGAGFRIVFLAPGVIAELVPAVGAPALVPRHGPPSRRRERRLLASAAAVVVADGARNGGFRAAVEALALGTPVVALRGGPLADVIEHGRTGQLVDEPSEIPAAVARAKGLDREEVRATALRRFDGARMVRRYLQLYERLVEREAADAMPSHFLETTNRPEEATG